MNIRYFIILVCLAVVLTAAVLAAGFIFNVSIAKASEDNTSFNKINQLTEQLKSNNKNFSKIISEKEKNEKLSLMDSIAKERKSLMKELAKKNPKLFLSLAMKKSQRSAFPSKIQANIEKEAVITAKTEVLHIDDFKEFKNSRFEYYLKTKQEKLSF